MVEVEQPPFCPNGCGQLNKFCRCHSCGYALEEWGSVEDAIDCTEMALRRLKAQDWSGAQKWLTQARGYLVIEKND